MNKISVLFAVLALAFAELVFANAVVTTVTGSATVQTGTGPSRPLRLGDEVKQGDTIATAAASNVVLKFDDGQVAALTANSRMTITNYQYNAQARTGNVLLSLVSGGMRAVTGLIGRNSPQNVSYRAATATIGIRGTDVIIGTDGGNVVVRVVDGTISFFVGGKEIAVVAGTGVALRQDGTFTQGTAADIVKNAPQAVIDAVGSAQALTNAINNASPGQPRSGSDPSPQLQSGQSVITTTPGAASSAGGGAASPKAP